MRLISHNRLLCAAAVFVLATVALSTSARGAEPPVNCVWNGFSYDCHTQLDEPGTPGTQAPTGGLTAGSTGCSLAQELVPCSNKYGSFVNDSECSGYVKLASTQDPRPSGQVDGAGAWYECTFACAALQDPQDSCPAGIGALDYWSNTPPPGVVQYTPAQAAAALARSFKLTPITIGMAPARKAHHDDPAGSEPYRRTWVGVPVWLWVADPKPLTYGPYAQTATLGGVTVTARATVTQVVWTSGAGDTVTCGAGTPFDLSAWAERPAADSQTCGFRFQRTSTDQPDGTWNVTATSHWTVAWTGGGQSGTLLLTNLTATTPVQVGELQSVNLPTTAGQIGTQQ